LIRRAADSADLALCRTFRPTLSLASRNVDAFVGTTGLRASLGAATMPAVRTAEFPFRRRVAAGDGKRGTRHWGESPAFGVARLFLREPVS